MSPGEAGDSEAATTVPWVHLAFGQASTEEVARSLGARLEAVPAGSAAIVDLTAAFVPAGAAPQGDEIKVALEAAMRRGITLVVAAIDEGVRLDLIRSDVEHLVPVRFDVGDAEVILLRMITV